MIVMSEQVRIRTSSCRNGHPPERSYWGAVRRERSGGQWVCRECVNEASARYRNTLDLLDRDARLDEHASRQRFRNRKMKLDAIDAYGGACQCCGETDWRKLTIDHIDGSGHIDRKKERGQRQARNTSIYLKLKRLGYPKDNSQLLCWSCNAVKYYFPDDPCCPNRTVIGA